MKNVEATIRELYFMQTKQIYSLEENEELRKAREELEPLHDKIVQALKIVYGHEAEEIENDWYGTLASISSEEAFQDFKDGLYLGFDIALAMMKR